MKKAGGTLKRPKFNTRSWVRISEEAEEFKVFFKDRSLYSIPHNDGMAKNCLFVFYQWESLDQANFIVFGPSNINQRRAENH